MLALTTYEWFKAFHVLAAVLWVGGSVMLTILGVMTIGLKDPVRMTQFAKQVSKLGGVYFPPLSLIVVGLGFGLVEKGDWGYDPTWIQIGIAGWAASFVIGAGYLGQHSSKLAKLMDTQPPESPEVQILIRRILTAARIDGALLLFVVFDMVAKPWS